MARVLVTGGAGFVGSWLCERLLARGDSVVAVDNLSTGALDNIRHLGGDFQFFERNIATDADILDPVDLVFNLACPASPVHYQADPIDTLQTSVLGAMRMLSRAQSSGAKILQASTSEIYGDPLAHPQTEGYWGNVNPIGPRACYDEGKRAAETLFFDYHRQYGTRIKVARIFNTYGPRMAADDGRVVSNFIVAALRGRTLEIYGDGSQTRSFCYVDDLVRGLIRLMDSPDDVTGPINFGNPCETTVRRLAELVIELTGSRSGIVRRPLPVDDPCRRCPDVSRAWEALRWEPTVALREGLWRTISYFDRALSQPFAAE